MSAVKSARRAECVTAHSQRTRSASIFKLEAVWRNTFPKILEDDHDNSSGNWDLFESEAVLRYSEKRKWINYVAWDRHITCGVGSDIDCA